MTSRYGKDTTVWWDGYVQPIFADASDGGILVTPAELAQVLQTTLPDGVTVNMTETLLVRLNNTYYRWQNGVMSGPDMIDATTVIDIVNEMENYTEEAAVVCIFTYYFGTITV